MTSKTKTSTEKLTEAEHARYARQLRMTGFDETSQCKLKSATAFVSRVGGVGAAVSVNLARAGIGRLILAHSGKVTTEYLNRNPLTMTEDVGKPMIEVVTARLKDINPAVEIIPFSHNVSEEKVGDMVDNADIIIDGAPLFEERYAMNQEAVRRGIPLVMAAMYGTEGYLTTIVPNRTPCLACIYPEKPTYWTDIQVFPVLGPGSMVVGTMAAMEAIKVITGFGEPLENKLCFFDLGESRFKQFEIERRPDCAVCGTPN